MRVLVTGGAGFIGSHVVPCLLDNGHTSVVVDNLATGNRENIPDRVRLIELDVLDKNLSSVIADNRFDAIIHLAAQTMVDASIKDPRYDASQNVMGTIAVLELARIHNIKRVILASTAAVYGNICLDNMPVLETAETQPLSFYGLTKKIGEDYLRLYHEHYGIEYVVLRLANVYGERQGDSGEGGVVSIFARKIAIGEPLTIYGDGRQTRDFIYVGDVARGFEKALSVIRVNDCFNLSTQAEVSVLELVEHFHKATSKDFFVNFAEARIGDISRSMLSNEKARLHLDWEPLITIDNGLSRVYDYVSQVLDRAMIK